jgi:hypothetical protein
MTAAANHTMRFICMECKRQYKTLRVERDLGELDISHGFCPECDPKVQERWFGKRKDEIEALR